MIDSIRGTQLIDNQGRAATADYRLFTTDCTNLLVPRQPIAVAATDLFLYH